MSAIITTKFRYQNASNLAALLGGSGSDSYYLFIGRTFAWPNDSNPPLPNDAQFDEYDTKRNIIALKKISGTSISKCIPRYNWISGNSYTEYDDQNTLLTTLQYYVVTDELGVYKCIKAGPSGSSIKPSGISSFMGAVLADGYQWKYMYTLTGNDVAKFLTATFISTKYLLSDDTTSQWGVQEAALPGAIHRIKITNGGLGYVTKPTVTITGDGKNCTVNAADITMSGTSVSEIVMNSARIGSDYTSATVNFTSATGTGAIARAIISPPGGHGANAADELGAFYIMVDVQLIADDGAGDFIVDNDFRQIGLITNPKLINTNAANLRGNWVAATEYAEDDAVRYYNTTYTCTTLHTAAATFDADLATYWVASTQASTATLAALTKITYSTLVGTLAKDQNIVGTSSTAVGYIDSLDIASSTIKFHQNNTTGFKYFQVGEIATIGAATVTITGIIPSEYEPQSGTVVYIENLSPVNRNISQTEDIKLVLEM